VDPANISQVDGHHRRSDSRLIQDEPEDTGELIVHGCAPGSPILRHQALSFLICCRA
jgi:hypothetical protein